MTYLEYLESLRKAIWFEITGTEDANQYLWADESRPNSCTKKIITSLLREYLYLAAPFGLCSITYHADCTNPNHKNSIKCNSEVTHNPHDDPNYDWLDLSLCGLYEYSQCPCSVSNKKYYHDVSFSSFYKKGDHGAAFIASILEEFEFAILNAENKRPRSGIREYLLRAIIQLDEIIHHLEIAKIKAGKP